MMNVTYDHEDKAAPRTNKEDPLETRETFVMKKYMPAAQKIRPVYQDLLDKFRIIHGIKGNPLDTLPKLNRNPPDFVQVIILRKEKNNLTKCTVVTSCGQKIENYYTIL